MAGEQRAYLDDFWERADVEIDGDAELQQAVRFALFHTLQSGARAEQRAIPAKGLTGPGYDGHAFWDTEAFVLPGAHLHRARTPRATRSPGVTARSTLARERARHARAAGGGVPVADDQRPGVLRLLARRHRGLPHLRRDRRRGGPLHGGDRGRRVRRRAWASSCSSKRRACGDRSATTTPPGGFRIDGVTGPDEYSAIADNNVYTNLMARAQHARGGGAAERARAARGRAGRDRGGGRELARRGTGDDDPVRLGATSVHPQAESFTEHAVWDFEATHAEQYPLFLHFPYFELYRKQVVKQADLVLALHVRGDAFTRRGEGARLRLLRGANRA